MCVIFHHSAMVSIISVLHCNLNRGPRPRHTHLYYYSNHDYYATVRYLTFCLIIFQVPQVAAPTRPLPLPPSPTHPPACCCIQLVPAEGVFGSPAAAAPHLWQQFLHFYFHLMCVRNDWCDCVIICPNDLSEVKYDDIINPTVWCWVIPERRNNWKKSCWLLLLILNGRRFFVQNIIQPFTVLVFLFLC